MAILIACLLVAILVSLAYGQRIEESRIDAAKGLAAQLAKRGSIAFQSERFGELKEAATDLVGRDDIVAVSITDQKHAPVFEQIDQSYSLPMRFPLPPVFDIDRPESVSVTDSDDAWRFSMPIFVLGAAAGLAPERKIWGYASIVVSKQRINAARLTALGQNIVWAIALAAVLSAALAWFVWQRSRSLRVLLDLLHGRDVVAEDMREASKGSTEVFSAIREYQKTLAMAGERERTLRQARDEAFGAALAKAQFVAKVSHEVRTPINGIVGMLDVLKRGDLTAAQQENVEIAWNSAESLMQLLNSVLDFSRLEAGKFEMSASEVNLHQFVVDVARIFAKQAAYKGIGLDWKIDPSVPIHVVVDAVRLRQILSNLLDNAVKFTDVGEIVLSVEVTNEKDRRPQLKFSVSDTGIGLTDAGTEKIFEEYTRDGQTHRLGTGLGLAIAKQLVRMMGGDIGVTSEKGRGSTFWFTMAYDSAQEVGDKQIHDMAPSSDRRTQVSARESTQQVDAGLRVLVVDDNRTNLRVASQMLTLIGCRVECCANGTEAVDRFRTGKYAAVLMDCNMPGMNGYEAAAKMRSIEASNPERARTTIFAVSANHSEDNRTRCINVGMDELLAKPITIERLRNLILRTDKPAVAEGDRRSPASQREGSPLLDEDGLERLRQLLGANLADAIVPFLEDVPGYLDELQEAVLRNDQQRTISMAHTIKGCSSEVGALRLHEQAKIAETLARQSKLAEISQVLDAMRATFSMLVPLLRAEMDKRPVV